MIQKKYPKGININSEEDEILQKVALAAKELSVEAYVIGGFVRDKLLKKTARKDIDFVCVGSGVDFAVQSAGKFENSSEPAIFKNFGTAMFKVDDFELEFVGARKESYDQNSRKPMVENGTLEDDQKRRDFTINALAISLNEENYGKLLDPFDGIKDLKKRLVQTPLDPDKTFSDDPLRMLRAIRFAAQLDFRIEEKTFASIKNNSHRIEIISMERISSELNKILMVDKPSYGMDLMFKSGLLKYFLPELVELEGVEIIEGHGHKDNFYHTLKVVDNLAQQSDDLWLRWAALLHDIGKPRTKRFEKGHGWTFHAHDVVGAKMVNRIFKRLRLPLNEKMRFVEKLVLLHLRPIGLDKENITDSAIRRLLYDAGDDIDDLMDLCEADITSKNEYKVKKYLQNLKLVRLKLKELEEKDHIRNFQPPVSGEDIMKAFYIKPGKEIGVIKNMIKEAILDGKLPNKREAALEYMYDLGKQMGLKAVNE
ncbi:MAG: HD domain-containing protein [Chitinophagaceae bacterium]|nr:MAG: HD domain-containing protein [Chitinophagaceae bacterium]